MNMEDFLKNNRYCLIFTGFTAYEATNRSEAAKIGNFSLNIASFRMWPFVI